MKIQDATVIIILEVKNVLHTPVVLFTVVRENGLLGKMFGFSGAVGSRRNFSLG